MSRLQSTAPPSRHVPCRIEASDVEAMLDAYDSGMCDISTANCISRAVARRLCCGRSVPLIRHSRRHAELDLHGQRIPLSAELLEWLGVAETGGPVEPFEFVLQIPGPKTAPSVVAPALALPTRKRRPSPTPPPLETGRSKARYLTPTGSMSPSPCAQG
jgi:hypothetical protein